MDETLHFAEDKDIRQRLEAYVKGVLAEFGRDPRVLMWNMVNEPGNSLLMENAMPLVQASFTWARQVLPAQPLTAGTWMLQTTWDLSLFQLEQSDIVTFHSYDNATVFPDLTASLREQTARPMICTEYMARTMDSRFETHMPIMLAENIRAINWGLVSGKTQTIYSWTSKEGAPEPEVWFHDMLRIDGTPFEQSETDFIKTITGNAGTR